MLLAMLAIVVGFALLVWSADRFVDGAAASANHAGMPPLLVGMLVVGFGTSAPEMVVSMMAAMDGNSPLALGNALGSNIVNITLILGMTAIIAPIAVHSNIIRKELPILLIITLVVGLMLWNHDISTMEAWLLLGGFLFLICWSIWQAIKGKNDYLDKEFSEEIAQQNMPLKRAIFWLVLGLLLLIASSRVLVWGAVEIATQLGVSDLLIGLTIVALGTSLPELAASIAAAHAHDEGAARPAGVPRRG